MKMLRFLAPVGAFLLAACSSMPKTSNNFVSVESTLDNVTIMPAVVSIENYEQARHDDATAFAAVLQDEVSSVVEQLSREARFQTTLVTTPREDLGTQIGSARTLFDKLARSDGKQLEVAAPIEVTTTPSDTRFVLYVEGRGYFAAFGRVMKDDAMGFTNKEDGVIVRAMLVDADDKSVLWFNQKKDVGPHDPENPDDRERLRRTCAGLLSPLFADKHASRDSFWGGGY